MWSAEIVSCALSLAQSGRKFRYEAYNYKHLLADQFNRIPKESKLQMSAIKSHIAAEAESVYNWGILDRTMKIIPT